MCYVFSASNGYTFWINSCYSTTQEEHFEAEEHYLAEWDDSARLTQKRESSKKITVPRFSVCSRYSYYYSIIWRNVFLLRQDVPGVPENNRNGAMNGIIASPLCPVVSIKYAKTRNWRIHILYMFAHIYRFIYMCALYL